MRFLLCSLLVGLVDRAIAQNFSVPSSWRKPTTNLDFVRRSALARGATDAITPLIDPSQGTIDAFDNNLSADLVAVLALQDVYSGNGTNVNFATNNLQLFQTAGHANYYSDNQHLNSDAIYWGLAAYYTYRAYKQDFVLQVATGVWDHVSTYFVTEAQAANKSHPTRNVPIASQCNGTSTAGAVFWLPDTLNDTSTNGETVGPYMALSAYLFETTGDYKYSSAAELTGEFIRNHMYNGTIVLDGVDLTSCVQSTGLSTYNTGYYVEALAVLANVTSNTTWSDLLGNLVADSAQFGAWTRTDGVITESGNDNAFLTSIKSTLIRGLHETWARNDRSTAMATFIESFIAVQFNALLDLATIPGSNNYTQNWAGPPLPELHSSGNVAALDVFNAMFDMATRPTAAATSSAAPTPTSADSSSSSNRSSSNTGAIVGGVIGGIVGVILIAAAIFFFMRRRRNAAALEGNLDGPNSPPATRQAFHVEPFLASAGTPPPAATPTVSIKGRPRYVSPDTSVPSLSATSPPPTESVAGASAVGYNPVPQEDASLAELPALVRRLNGILGRAVAQDIRREEPPPEYHASA